MNEPRSLPVAVILAPDANRAAELADSEERVREDERARIRAAVEGLLDPDTGKSWNHALNTVLRIIDGGEG